MDSGVVAVVRTYRGVDPRQKARFPLPQLTARVNGPSWRVMETGHPSTRAVNSGSGNRA